MTHILLWLFDLLRFQFLANLVDHHDPMLRRGENFKLLSKLHITSLTNLTINLRFASQFTTSHNLHKAASKWCNNCLLCKLGQLVEYLGYINKPISSLTFGEQCCLSIISESNWYLTITASKNGSQLI